jgi:hypothetical protein
MPASPWDWGIILGMLAALVAADGLAGLGRPNQRRFAHRHRGGRGSRARDREDERERAG